MTVFRFISIFSIALMLFLIIGCNDTPNSIGKGTQPPEDYGVTHVDTFYATGHSSNPNIIYTSSADRFMLGKYQTYQAWACLKFYAWPDSLIGAKITSASINLKGVYHFGDSTAALTFDIYRAKASLTNDSLSYDSLSLNGSYYYQSNPILIQSLVPVGDNECTTINILDTTMLREWFSTNTDTMHLNDGLVFKPTNSNIIKGFYSSINSDTSRPPTLFVNYIDANGKSGSYSHKISFSKFVSTVNQASLINDNNFIYVQSGISYRGLISFDSITLSAPQPIIRAVLQFTSGTSTSVSHDSLVAHSVGSSGVSDGISYAISQCSTDISGHKIYSFEVGGKGQIAPRWLSNASIRKVAISGYSESSSFDLFKLYGNGEFRPRIIITYPIQR